MTLFNTIQQRQLKPLNHQYITSKNIKSLLKNHLYCSNVIGKESNEECIYAIQLNHDATRVAISTTNVVVHLYSTSNGKLQKTLSGHSEIITAISWLYPLGDCKNSFFTSSLDRTIRLWKNEKQVCVLKDHADWIRCMSISTDNSSMVSGCVSSTICGWDVEAAKVVFRISHNPSNNRNILNSVNSLNFANQNSNVFVSGCRDGYVRLYDKRTDKKCIMEFLAHGTLLKPSKVNYVEFGIDDLMLISSGRDSCIRLWDVRNLKGQDDFNELRKKALVREFNKHKCTNYNLGCMLFNNGNNIISGSEDKIIYIYDIHTGEVLNKLVGHDSAVHLVHTRDNAAYPFMFISSGIESSCVYTWKPSIEKDKKSPLADMPKREEDPLISVHRAFVESLVSKLYGDQILQLYHSRNNVNFNSGLDVLLSQLCLSLMETNSNDTERQITLFNMLQDILQGITRTLGGTELQPEDLMAILSHLDEQTDEDDVDS